MTRPNRTRRSRGQAMVEYSMLNFVLILALVMGSQVKMLPGPSGPLGKTSNRVNVIEAFLYAYQTYYDSFYFVLNMPFP